MLNNTEDQRYNRNILINEIGTEGQNKLLKSKVLICGAGGLGSILISTLSSLGIGTIGIIDGDVIEISNLNRQFIHSPQKIGKLKVESAKEWINSFNPQINVEIHPIRLNINNYSEIIGKYDLVIDCFDSFKSKFMLNEICVKNKKTLIHGGVTEFYGQIMTIIPEKSSCLMCLFNEYNENAFNDNPRGVISPVVNTIGSIQAMEAVKILLNHNTLLINSFLSYDGLKQEFKKFEVKQNNNCPVCGRHYNI